MFELKVTNSKGFSSTDTLNVILSGTLPVKLLSFSAIPENGKVQLQWQTTSEINSSNYVVERSNDGRVFESIGSITSNNNGNLQSSYSLADNMPLKGTSYYRLAMVDRDGSIAYSRTVSVNIRNNKSFIINNLSLSGSSIKININSNQQQVINLAVIDVAGRVVMAKKLQLQTGENALVNDIPGINKAVYYIKLFTAADAVVKTVLSE